MLKHFSRNVFKQRSVVNTIENSQFISTRRFLTSLRPVISYNNRTNIKSNIINKNFIPFIQYGNMRFYSSPSNPDDFPPHILLTMPALSPTMTDGYLREWYKKPGDEVVVGDVIAEIETDKASMSWESIDDGYMAKIFPTGDDKIPCNKVVAILAEEADDIDKFEKFVPPEFIENENDETQSENKEGEEPKPKEESKKDEPKEDKPKKEETKKDEQKSQQSSKSSSGGRIVASPVARAVAEELGVNLKDVTGSGPNGRIVLNDVQKFKGTKSTPKSTTSSTPPKAQSGSYEDIPNNSIRKIIASRLTESKQKIPHYYLTIDFCVDKLQGIRADLNSRANGKYKLSINDFVIKASAMAMRKVPEVNSSWSENSIRRYNDVNINVAVNSDLGLFTPIIPSTDNRGLIDIANSVRNLADKAKDGKLTSDELQIGTFTISNLGMFGIKQFAAVINPPQACILAVGGIETRVVPDGDSWKTSNFMTCTLSCDHRVVDGALGAQWLKEFKSKMEDPITLLL